MPFEEDGVAGEAVDAEVDECQRAERAEDELAIMHHPVGVSGGLAVEPCIDRCLIACAFGLDTGATLDADHGGHDDECDEQ